MTNRKHKSKIADIAESSGNALDKLFPGIAMGSRSRAAARANERALKALRKAKDELKDMGASDELIDEYCGAVARQVLRSKNLKSVVAFAEQMDPNPVDCFGEDLSWVDSFVAGAEQAYDEDVQRLWGKLLAGEMENPGAYSKRAMTTLRDMSSREAELFERLCSFTVEIDGEHVPMVTGTTSMKQGIPAYIRMESDELSLLKDAGLIDYSEANIILVGSSLDAKRDHVLVIGSNEYRLQTTDNEAGLNWINVHFTSTGNELARLCGQGCAEGFEAELIEELSRHDWEATKV